MTIAGNKARSVSRSIGRTGAFLALLAVSAGPASAGNFFYSPPVYVPRIAPQYTAPPVQHYYVAPPVYVPRTAPEYTPPPVQRYAPAPTPPPLVFIPPPVGSAGSSASSASGECAGLAATLRQSESLAANGNSLDRAAAEGYRRAYNTACAAAGGPLASVIPTNRSPSVVSPIVPMPYVAPGDVGASTGASEATPAAPAPPDARPPDAGTGTGAGAPEANARAAPSQVPKPADWTVGTEAPSPAAPKAITARASAKPVDWGAGTAAAPKTTAQASGGRTVRAAAAAVPPVHAVIRRTGASSVPLTTAAAGISRACAELEDLARQCKALWDADHDPAHAACFRNYSNARAAMCKGPNALTPATERSQMGEALALLRATGAISQAGIDAAVQAAAPATGHDPRQYDSVTEQTCGVTDFTPDSCMPDEWRKLIASMHDRDLRLVTPPKPANYATAVLSEADYRQMAEDYADIGDMDEAWFGVYSKHLLSELGNMTVPPPTPAEAALIASADGTGASRMPGGAKRAKAPNWLATAGTPPAAVPAPGPKNLAPARPAGAPNWLAMGG